MTAVAADTGRIVFVLTDPRYGSGEFFFSGVFSDTTPTQQVLMEDGYGDGDYDDNVLEVTIHGHYDLCRLWTDSVLNIHEFRDSLIAEWMATRADPLRTERGGHVYRNRVTGEWRWAKDSPVGGGTADACHIDLTAQPMADEDVIESWHTHGYFDGEILYDCNGGTSGTPMGVVNYRRHGGGSLGDWPATNGIGYDALTIDSRQVNVLSHSKTNPVAFAANLDRYFWHGIGQCLTLTP